MTAADRLDATFAALSHPARRAILARLSKGEASVLELAEPFDMTQPAISKHLKVLEQAGLVSRGRDAQRRPCRIEAAPLADANTWIEGYRRFWEPQFERLDGLLAELQSQARAAYGADSTAPSAGPRRSPPRKTRSRKPHTRRKS